MEVRFTKSRAAFTTAITIMGVMGVTSTIMEGMEGKSEAGAWGARTFPHVFDFLGHFKLLLKMSKVSNWELMSETRNTYIGTNAQEYVVISKSIGCWTLYVEKVTPVGKGHYSSHNTLYEAIRMAETITPWTVNENMESV